MKPPFRSIRWRLQLWYGLLFAALLAGLGLTAYHFEATSVRDRFDDELAAKAFELSAAQRRGPGGGRGKQSPRPPPPGKTAAPSAKERPAPPPPEDTPAADASAGGSGNRRTEPAAAIAAQDADRGHYYAIWLKNGTPFTASANAPADLPQPPERLRGNHARVRGLFREAWVAPDYGDAMLVGRSFAAAQADLHRFAWKLTLAGLAILAVALAIGWVLATRVLRPIHDIGTAAAKIATGDLSQRINTRDTDSELGRLAGVLNSTFSRLETSFAQQARFTADAAHELRTPVTVMLTHAQNGLATAGLTAEQRESFEACQRAAQRMRKLIEALLALARLDAGQESLRAAPLDLADLARECAALIRPLAAQRRITLHTDLAAAPCLGDATQLEQVVTNLLANAIHHNRDGGEIRLSTRTDDGHGVIVVADNGPGIAPEHLPRLFDRFYRVDKARTVAQGRTGLGLAISRAIVEAHGGTIEVASTPGEGATFTVRLPAAAAE